MTRHILRVSDLSLDEIAVVLDYSTRAPDPSRLKGQGAALVFEHPSARTRSAAEMAVYSMGGHPVTIRGEEVGFDVRETVEDVSRTLGCYHSIIGARVVSHSTLQRMAKALDKEEMAVPVINLLSDLEHPTQAIADLLTIRDEFVDVKGRIVTFLGDGNNVARSLIEACVLVGASVRIATPPGFELASSDLDWVRELGGDLSVCSTAEEAADGADVLYTDVWVSMGERGDAQQKRSHFGPYSLSESLVSLMDPKGIVLHCLPAHRGEEIEESVLEGGRSRVWPQVANRQRAIRGLIEFVLDKRYQDR